MVPELDIRVGLSAIERAMLALCVRCMSLLDCLIIFVIEPNPRIVLAQLYVLGVYLYKLLKRELRLAGVW